MGVYYPQNLGFVRILIFDSDGDVIFEKYLSDLNGNIGTFQWDGKDLSGNMLPPDVYTYKVDLVNCDGKDVKVGTITLLSHDFNVPGYDDSHSSWTWYPRRCCLSDYTLTEDVVGHPEFYIINNINIEANVTGDNTGVFVAGNEIVVDPSVVVDGAIILENTILDIDVCSGKTDNYIGSAWEETFESTDPKSSKIVENYIMQTDLTENSDFEENPEETQAKAVENPALRIYPNPFGTELSIQSETQLLEVWLTDLYGRKIISSNSLQTNTYTLSTQVLSSGCYILHLRTENGISTHKVCKE